MWYKKFGCGIAVEADGASLAAGVDTVLAGLDTFRDKAIAARDELRGTHSWKRVVDVVVSTSNTARLQRVPAPARSEAKEWVPSFATRIQVSKWLRGRRVATGVVAVVLVTLGLASWAAASLTGFASLAVLVCASLTLQVLTILLGSLIVMRRFDRLKQEAEKESRAAEKRTRDAVKRQLGQVEMGMTAELKEVRRLVKRLGQSGLPPAQRDAD